MAKIKPKLSKSKSSQWEIIDDVSTMGYRDDSPYRDRKSIDIHSPNGLIDMSETGMPILANGKYLPPYSGMHQFKPGVVKEERIMQDGGNVNPIEGDLYSKVLMNRNKDKDFVQRANFVGQYPNSPMFNQWDDFDTKATHKMGWGEDDSGQAFMFPTIMNKDNEAIKVPNQYANYISEKGYKKATGMPVMQTGGRAPLEISDPREFKIRQQAYQDSSDLYNNYQQLMSSLKNQGYEKENPWMIDRLLGNAKTYSYQEYVSRLQPSQKRKEQGNLYSTEDFIRGKINPNLPRQLFSTEILPEGMIKYTAPDGTDDTNKENDARAVAIYKNVKPVQPVVYKPTILNATLPAPISTVTPSTTSTYKSLEPLRPKQTSIELPQLNTQISQEQQQQLETNPYTTGSYFTVDRGGQQSGGAGFSDRRTQMTDYYDNKTGKKLGAYPKKQFGGNIQTENEWEILPEAEDGKKIKPKYEWSNQQTTTPSITVQGNNNVSRTEGNRKLTKQETEQLRLYNEIQNQLNKEREYNQRKQNIQQSIEAQGQPLSTENLKTQTQATGDKLSFAMNTPYGNPNQYPVASQYINALDEINFPKFIGDKASDLGAAPQDVKEGNYLKAAMSVVNPLVVGALAGMGTQGTKQFVNNLANPFAGIEVPNVNKSTLDRLRSNLDRYYETGRLPETNLDNIVFRNTETPNRTYNLDSDVDYDRYLSLNQLPPPPSEIQFMSDGTSRNFYNNVEANINTTRIRDLSPDILGSIDLRKYKDLNIKELTLKNPSLAEKLKNKLSKQYDILKGKVKQKDIAVGQFLDKNLLNKTQKFEDVIEAANKNLNKGMGISKEKLNIELKPNSYDNTVYVYINGEKTGHISLPEVTKDRKLSEIISRQSNKRMGFENAPLPGRRKSFDFPFSDANVVTKFEGKGVSGEINTAISEALKAKGERLYSGGTGHTAAGANRYNKLIEKGKVDIIDPKNKIYMYKELGGKIESDWEILQD